MDIDLDTYNIHWLELDIKLQYSLADISGNTIGNVCLIINDAMLLDFVWDSLVELI